jgi:hypothetical protein
VGGYERGWTVQVEKRDEWAAARFEGGEAHFTWLSPRSSLTASTLSDAKFDCLERSADVILANSTALLYHLNASKHWV